MTASKHIRTLSAYTLLCVMALQWLAGSMYLKMTYLIATRTEMNEAEQAIANDVMDQFGFDVQVNLVDASDMNFINGLGYAAPFVHTLEMDGSMNTFTLTQPVLQYQHVECVIKERNGMQHKQKDKICFEKLFSQFCFGESDFSKSHNNRVFTQHNFAVTSLYHIFDHSDPSPPPKPA